MSGYSSPSHLCLCSFPCTHSFSPASFPSCLFSLPFRFLCAPLLPLVFFFTRSSSSRHPYLSFHPSFLLPIHLRLTRLIHFALIFQALLFTLTAPVHSFVSTLSTLVRNLQAMIALVSSSLSSSRPHGCRHRCPSGIRARDLLL